MKIIKIISTIVLVALVLMMLLSRAYAATPPIGDITLAGPVERSGRLLANHSSVFEGDVLRTGKAGTGVIRAGRGRVEIGELSEVEIVRAIPLRIVVKAGEIGYNFPPGADFEIVTPQLEVRPEPSQSNLSGRVAATPQKEEDRVSSSAGSLRVLEREANGAVNRIREGQTLVASLVPYIPAPQGPLRGPQIAVIEALSGDVRVARAATPRNLTRVTAPGFGLATNDLVRTLARGVADIRFTDNSLITLTPGATIQIQQQQTQTGITRRIQHFIGSLWFNIQRVAGTQTTLQTPTAVAAIRGTEGMQEVPNDFQSTHLLNDGEQEITELVTQQSLTLRGGQRVTVIRGIGFTPIAALLALVPKPSTGAPGTPAPGTGTGVGTVATTATASIVTSTILPIATTVISTVPSIIAANEAQRASPSGPQLLPGGGQ